MERKQKQTPSFDLERMARLMGGNPALVHEVLHTFLIHHRTTGRQIRLWCEQGELAAAERLAGRMEAIAGTLAAEPMAHAAHELQRMLRQKRRESIEGALRTFCRALDTLLHDIQAELAGARA
ncbi:MAG: hypothetical protein D6682_03820 [Zetaproteobacteria bacterium]|nr:MAG: hypothetical protein D6682_03820 [Zetaproteobacteria bacterium]